MQLCDTPRATSAVFDDPNLVSAAGLVPVVALARSSGLDELARQHLTVPTDIGANAGLKVASLVAGWRARTASMTWRCCVTAAWVDCSPTPTRPRRWGRSLRSFTFGHVRQLDAVASRFHRGPWLLQPGLGLRLLRGARPQRVARHGEHQGLGAGGRGPAAPEGIVWLPSRCRPAHRRRPEDHRHARRQQRTGAGACRLSLLRPRSRRCRASGQQPGRAPHPAS